MFFFLRKSNCTSQIQSSLQVSLLKYNLMFPLVMFLFGNTDGIMQPVSAQKMYHRGVCLNLFLLRVNTKCAHLSGKKLNEGAQPRKNLKKEGKVATPPLQK